MSQPILPLAVWESGTNNNSIPANDNALRVEVALREAISIADSEPGAPSERDLHIVGTPWGGFTTNNAVIYLGGTWYEYAAFEGWFKSIAGNLRYFDGTDWVATGGGAVDSVNSQAGTVVLDLGDLDDVDDSAPDDGDVLTWNDSAGEWEPQPASGGGGGIPDAPSDGKLYGRKDAAWEEVPGGGGGGLTHFSESIDTTGPNTTVPVVALAATNAASAVDAAFLPKGAGAFSLDVADGTIAGGNKRGANAVDLQMVRNHVAQVASGPRSLVAGYNCLSSAQAAIALGENCEATASSAFAAGSSSLATANYTVAMGRQSMASGEYAVALGGGTANGVESFAFGRGANTNSVFGAVAEATFAAAAPQRTRYTLQGSTTSATPVVLTTDGFSAAATNQVYMGNQNNRSGIYRCLVVARQTGNGGAKKSWEFLAHLDRDAGNVALVDAVTPTVIADSGVPWDIAVAANNSLKTLEVTATGEASKTIRWACYVDGQEVKGT